MFLAISNVVRLRQIGFRMLNMIFSARHSQLLDQSALEQLAGEIVNYCAMVDSSNVVVWVPDVAFRLRESAGNIRRALLLLEVKELACKTNARDYWMVRGSSPGLVDAS